MSYQLSPAQAVESAGGSLRTAPSERQDRGRGGLRRSTSFASVEPAFRVMGTWACCRKRPRPGGFKMQGRGADAAAQIVADARALEDAGVLSPSCLRPCLRMSQTRYPCGRRADESGLAPVRHAMDRCSCAQTARMSRDHAPASQNGFADSATRIVNAAACYVEEVRSGAFPAEQHVFKPNRAEEAAADGGGFLARTEAVTSTASRSDAVRPCRTGLLAVSVDAEARAAVRAHGRIALAAQVG